MDEFAVIFDMDGVLVDNNAFHKIAWKEFCKKHSFDLSDEELKNHVYGKINPEIIRYLFGKNISKEDIDVYSKEKEKLYRGYYKEHIKPTKGLLGFLDILEKNNITKAIATSAPAENVLFVLDNIKAKDFFNIIIDETYVKHGKPHPEIYLKTAEIIKVKSSRCVVFEDSISGIKSAKSAGMKVIGITTTHSKDELYMADMVIDNFEEISIEIIGHFFEK